MAPLLAFALLVLAGAPASAQGQAAVEPTPGPDAGDAAVAVGYAEDASDGDATGEHDGLTDDAPSEDALSEAELGDVSAEIEEDEADEAEAEPDLEVPARVPYVRGVGRGFQYGSYLTSPYYFTDVRRAGRADRLLLGGGAGVYARLGWELPLGFSIELYGGLAGNAVDTQGVEGVNTVFLRGDVGVGARYMIYNDTIVAPFFQIGGLVRLLFFEWSTDPSDARTVSAFATFAMQAAVGVHFELAPYFGVEVGLAADYFLGLDAFEEGLFSLMPFAGVTLYLDDENDPLF